MIIDFSKPLKTVRGTEARKGHLERHEIKLAKEDEN